MDHRLLTRVGTLIVLAGLAAGCGGDPPKPPPDPDREKADGLREVYDLVKTFADAKNRGPGRAADLVEAGNAFPTGLDLVAKGEVVVVWGAVPKEAGAGVLAYTKDAPTAGGHVVTQGGEVKKLTAAEFAAAPKAK